MSLFDILRDLGVVESEGEAAAVASNQYGSPVGYVEGSKLKVMGTDGNVVTLAGSPKGLDIFIALQAYADTYGLGILYKHTTGQLYEIPAAPRVGDRVLVDPDAVQALVSSWGITL